MPKFFIDFRDGNNLFEDEEGSECRDLGQAQTEAIGVLHQVIKDQLTPGNNRSFASIVRDEHKKTVYVATMEFRCSLVMEGSC